MTSTAELVSIAMPCYNAAASLPMALASLIAQSYPDWECILVDDGSTDDPLAVVEQLRDSRIRCMRLPDNRGRGVARQVAMEQARGVYLAMLDADDWYYPVKLERQVAALRSDPRPALVSAGIAIVDPGGEIAGVRGCGPPGDPLPVLGPWQRMGPRLVSHAPSLIRMSVARAVRYEPGLRRSEDTDFLLQVLWNRCYRVLPEVTYAYAEYGSTSKARLIAGYSDRMRVLWRHRSLALGPAIAAIAQTWLKGMLYRLAFQVGAADRLVARRSRRPTGPEIAAYGQARRAVLDVLASKGLAGGHTGS